jgi:hypothetical protein
MLRQDVIDAVREGKFHLYAVRTVEEALSLLMKRPAGIMNPKGRYEKNTIFGQVMNQLKHWQQLEEGDRSKNDSPQKKKNAKTKSKAKAKNGKADDNAMDKEKSNPKKKPNPEKADKTEVHHTKDEKAKDEKKKPEKVKKVPRRDPEDNNDEESRIEWAGE